MSVQESETWMGHGMDLSVISPQIDSFNENLTIHRLVQTAHQQHADIRSMELQLNHSNLQVQTLSAREQELKDQVDMLQFTIASVEQDKLLLESKLQEIAGFEGSRNANNCSLSLKDIRGKLLNVANNKIGELSRALQNSKCEHEKSIVESVAEHERILSENQALREEVTRVSELMAQRTVLYAAQERRYHDTTRTYGSLTNEKDKENIELRARLQQLEQQYEKSDRAHIEAVLISRQLEESQKRLQAQLFDAIEKSKTIETDMSDLTSHNISLQATVERLRGADMDELERDLAAEVGVIRAESRTREEALMRQLQNAQELISSEAEKRELLVDEVERLRSELTGQSNLLREASDKGILKILPTSTVAHDFDTVSSNEMILDASMIETCSAGGRVDNVFAAMFGALDQAGLASDWDENSVLHSSNVAPHGHRYNDDDCSEDELDVKIAKTADTNAHSSNELQLPLMAASSLNTIKSLLCQLLSSGDCPGQETRCAAATDDQQRLFGALSQISRSNKLEIRECRLMEAWEDARQLTIETIRASTTLDPSLKFAAENATGLWDEVTSLLTQIMRLTTDKRDEWINMHEKQQQQVNAARESLQSVSLSKNFLTGAHSEDGGTAESSFISSSTHNAPTTVEGLLKEELACLKEELIRRKRREVKLVAAYKEQGGRLAVVLTRASELSLPLTNRSSANESLASRKHEELLAQQSDLVIRLQSEIAILRQQVEGFREELACAEKQAETTRQLGFAEAAEMYTARIRSLEGELNDVKALLGPSRRTTAESIIQEKSIALVHAASQADLSTREIDSQTDFNPIETAVEAPSKHDDATEDVAVLRTQICFLKQALLDSCSELEIVQSTFARERGGSDQALRELDRSSHTSNSIESDHSTSFVSAQSQIEDEETRKNMQDALKKHLLQWDERAESWTAEQAVILKKLEEAQTSLTQLTAKYEDEKRVALLSLRNNLVGEHDEALASLRMHHREEVMELISRLQREHSEAMMTATQAMQLQLQRLIASLAQDHQEELQKVTLQAYERSMDTSALSDTHSNNLSKNCTNVEASTITDDSYAQSAEGIRNEVQLDYGAKVAQLTNHQHESDIANALMSLKSQLEKLHEQDCIELVTKGQENERRHEEEKKVLVSKYRCRLKRQHASFVAEREQLLSLVKQEYNETFALVEENVRNSFDYEHQSREASFVIYPEMLSPETTVDLFQGIAGRVVGAGIDLSSSTESWNWNSNTSIVERAPEAIDAKAQVVRVGAKRTDKDKKKTPVSNRARRTGSANTTSSSRSFY